MAKANVMVRGVSSASTRRCCSPVDGNASGAHGDAVRALPELRDDRPALPIQVGRQVCHRSEATHLSFWFFWPCIIDVIFE